MTSWPGDTVVRAHGFSLSDMVATLDEAADRFVELLRSLDPPDGARAIPSMTWTVAETAAHVVSIVRRGLGDRRRADSIPGLAELNAQTIDELTERDVHVIAKLIADDIAAYVTILRSAPVDEVAGRVVRLHAGLRADIPTAISYQLFDFLVHGFDIANAVGTAWVIEPEHAALCLRAVLPALGPWVRQGVLTGEMRHATFAFGGSEQSVEARAGDGSYEVAFVPRVRSQREVDPAEMLLAVSGRVQSFDSDIAAIARWYEPI